MRIYKGIPQKQLITLLMGTLIICAGWGYSVEKSNGFTWRNINQKFSEMNAFIDWVSYPDPLHSHQVNGVDIWVTHPNQDPEILVLGDSHAEQYLERVYDLSKKTGKVAGFMTVAGCYTIKGVGNDKGGQCSKQPQAIEKLLQHEKLETILFSYIWGRYYKEHPNSFQEGLNQMIDLQQQQSHRNFFVLLDPPWDSGSYDIRRYAGASFNRLLATRFPMINLSLIYRKKRFGVKETMP